ncbi:MAG: ABC transporter ATP-binding protein [Actinomycetes bacterium]
MKVAELVEVSKSYGTAKALDRASFAVGEGEVVALLGPNGAGKSTAIAVLLGLGRPDRGVARLYGGDPRRPGSRRRVGVTPQESLFPGTLRVDELVRLIATHYAQPLPESLLFERFGLVDIAERQIGGLSVGQRRRLGVALAFVGRPTFIVLDEPTVGLDSDARRAVWAAIRDHRASGGTVLLTTHQIEEADLLADRVVLVEEGRIVTDRSVEALKASAGCVLVRFEAGADIRVPGAVRNGLFLDLHVRDAGRTVEELVRSGVPLHGLEVRAISLEEALAPQVVTP